MNAGIVQSASLGILLLLTGSAALIDLRRMIIPDEINLAIFVTGVAASFALGIVDPISAFVAALLAGAVLLAVRWGFRTYRGYDGLGLGDVKFVAAAAGWTGAEGLPVAVLAACLAALVYIVGRRALDMRFDASGRVPFGPFLAFGVVLVAAVQIATGGVWFKLLEPSPS